MTPRALPLPSKIELDLDPGAPLAPQVDAAIERYRSAYAWFSALGSLELQTLRDRIANACAGRIHGETSRAVSGRERVHIEFTADELQDVCAQLLPLAELKRELLAGLDLQPIFGDTHEEKRQNIYGQLVRAKYRRTEALSGIDPVGKKFCIDLSHLAGVGRELNFTALGSHGTLTAASDRMASASQFGGVSARREVEQQRNVGLGVMRWHAAMRKARTPSFGFLLGDNFYASRVSKQDVPVVDAMFEEGYYNLYNVLDRTALNIPYLAALGSHDYDLHGDVVVPSEGGAFAANIDRAIAEVDYTYRTGKNWHLPYRYYCAVSAVADFFVIDTATFLFDRAQQEWLRHVYAGLAGNGKWKFLMAHHGFVTFGKRAATEEQTAAAAAPGLKDDLDRHIFGWFVAEDLHFHVNVVAHDHFSAAALLTYDVRGGAVRRTYYVLAGGGGAALRGGNLDTLLRVGPNLVDVDLLEKKCGFATFNVTATTLTLDFRLLDGSSWQDGWGTPRALALDSANFWSLPRLDPQLKAQANPVLRGVFYKRGAGGLFHSSRFARRYFETMWGNRTFRYGEKPGSLTHSIDLEQVDGATCSWRSSNPRIQTVQGAPDLWHLSFDTRSPRRTWEFAVAQQSFHDLCAWIDDALTPR